MSKLISTLEQLHRIRTRAVDDMSLRLASQKQLCRSFEKNIAALSNFADGMATSTYTSAAQMFNQASYKYSIQRVIDWQKQEQALADIEARTIQGHLLNEVRREKSLSIVLDNKRADHQRDSLIREQKMNDAVSAQCWMRQQILRPR
ncbi:flagellar export protein FliJ [Citrobacter portucalensis]|uniref:flagellar export protein FliJ n=1 Tax=Citrobacter portucalensis TaxID=1639133 RepID=UPI003CF37885